MFNNYDIALFSEKGTTEEQIQQQLKRFATGFPYLKIQAVATVGNGIMQLNAKEESRYIGKWKEFLLHGGTTEKMVPASGAASRMFKNIFAFIAKGDDALPETDFEKQFFDNIKHFAFYHLLNKACISIYNNDVGTLISKSKYTDVAKALLSSEGLNYGALPKGLLKFHRTSAGTVHTPVEEHLEEGAQYAADAQRTVHLHFTVSHEHRQEFEKLLATKAPPLEQVWGVNYDISLSEQKPSTDTIAVNNDNTPYRDASGHLLFRPAGHGALLENLNERAADVIFIKNIDNVVPLQHRSLTTRYKKIIGGVLVAVQQQISDFLNLLDSGNAARDELNRMLAFVENTLCTHCPDTKNMDDDALATYLRSKLDRPIRVCGMVKNEGEPGGGPYLTYNTDGTISPQILEAAQINSSNNADMELMKSGTHFNPVDLVCYIKDYKGNKFDLKKYVDPETGLISEKSKDGVVIKALELPGLWNGSMSDWNTIFVEVPAATFNPVKTVNDLLRPIHST